VVILPHLLLQRGSSIGSLQGRKVQNLADVKPAGTNWNYLGKNKRIPNSQCQLRGHGEASSCLYLVQHSDTNKRGKQFSRPFSDHVPIKNPWGFPHITGREVCDRSPPKRRSLALPDPTDPVLLWLLQKPPWLWLAPVARQRGWWKDIEHGTKQLKQHHFQYVRTHVLYHIYIIYIIYNYIYTYMYITY
jgi:hypothetical protein